MAARQLLSVIVGLVIVIAAPPARSDDHEAERDAEARRLKGKWTAAEGVRDGKRLTKDELAKITLAFNGPQDGKFYFFTDLRPLLGQNRDDVKAAGFMLEPWQKPKQFTFMTSSVRSVYFRGIYKLDGDTLRICVDLRHVWGERDWKLPKEFGVSEGSGLTLLTLKRGKEK